MKRPLHTDEKIATLTDCEESYAKGYVDLLLQCWEEVDDGQEHT